MAKTSGVGITTLSIDDSAGTPRDIRTDINSFDLATPRGVQDTTGLDVSGMERLLLLADASISIKGVFDPAANLAHSVFRTVPSTSVQRTVSFAHAAQTLAMEMVFSDYAMARGQNAELTYTAPGALANGAVPTWA